MPETAWISIPAFAKQIGMTPQYIRRLIKNGKITESSLKPHGKRSLVNPKKALDEMAANTSYVNKKETVEHSPKVEKKTTKSKLKTVSVSEQKEIIERAGLEMVSLTEAQRLQANYMAALKELELKEKQGDLIPKNKVEKEAFEMARRVRDAILNIPNRISAELANITDPHLITDMLNTEFTAALEELSS